MIDFSWLDSDSTVRFCLTLLHSIWQFILLALVATVVSRLIKRRGVQWRYSVNVIALVIGLAMLPVTFALLSGHQAADNAPTTAFTQTGSNQVGLAPPTEKTEQTPINDQHAKSPATQVDQSPITAQTESFAATATSWPLSLATWAAALYVMGVVLMLLRLTLAIVRANRLAVQGRVLTDGPAFQILQRLADQWSMRVAPTLRLTEDVVAPKVVGVLRSTILLPTAALTGLSPDQLEMILAHELAHVRRHDMWVHLFQRIAEAILFFNPALWFLSRRISELREYCCDELACQAVAHIAGETRTRYAETLLRMVELNQNPTSDTKRFDAVASLAASGSSQSELRRRVAHLFGDPVCDPVRMTRGGAFTFAGALVLLFTVSALWNTGLSGQVPPTNLDDQAVSVVIQDSKPAVALEGSFADQFAGILKNVLEESELPFYTEQRAEEICDQFSKLTQLASIDLQEVSEERRIAILTSLRDNHARLLCLKKSSSREAAKLNLLYLRFPDLVKSLQWKMWMALSRGELNTDQQARQAKQRDWMRETILSLPDDQFARQQRELEELDKLFEDPLLPQFDQLMSEKQFTRFQQAVQEMLDTARNGKEGREDNAFGMNSGRILPHDPLKFIAFKFRLMAFESCWNRDNAAQIPRFDEDKIRSVSKVGTHSHLRIWFKFDSNEKHRKSGGLKDFYRGVKSSALDTRNGNSAETPSKILTPPDTKTAANDSADAWETAPSKEGLMELLKQRDAAFGDYLIEFDLKMSRSRHPFMEWHSVNWKRKPLNPPKNFDPPYHETKIRRYSFATNGDEEHMDWITTEVRKDGQIDEGSKHLGRGTRVSTWRDTVRWENYSDRDDEKLPEDPAEGDPRFPQLHKNSSSVPSTILDSNRMHYELCAGIRMSKRIKQIDTILIRDGQLHVTGKMTLPWGGDCELKMELTPSLLPTRIILSQYVVADGSKYRNKYVVQTRNKLKHENAPATPQSARFEFTTEIEPAEGKPWVRPNKKFDNLRFIRARGHLGADEFKKMTQMEFPSGS